MFVMLSVRTTSVCERHNKAITTSTTTTTNTTTTQKISNAKSTQTIQSSNITATSSSLTTTFDNLLINKDSIEKIFTKSVSFDKNINQSNLSLAQPNNLKEPPAQQVNKYICICSIYYKIIHFICWLFNKFLIKFGPDFSSKLIK